MFRTLRGLRFGVRFLPTRPASQSATSPRRSRRVPSVACALATSACVLAFSSAAESQVLWQKSLSNPVIPNSTGGGYALDPVVLFDSATTTYHMWFTAKEYGGPWAIFDALSQDGLAWFSYVRNPVLESSQEPFETEGVVYGGIVKDDAGYKML